MGEKIRRHQTGIFIFITFGITYLMGIAMCYGFIHNINIDMFPVTQMLYPASAVVLVMLSGHKGSKMPKKLFYSVLFTAALCITINILSLIFPKARIGNLSNVIIMFGSVLFWIMLFVEENDVKREYGLSGKNWKVVLKFSLLFLFLFIADIVIGVLLEGNIGEVVKVFANPWKYMEILTLPVDFFLGILMFFGEEYGWRFFLQPILQKRFGTIKGVLLLGAIWGIWHLPLVLFYYNTPEYALKSMMGQLITCITLGIFMAYVYMKTNNIWLPIIIHFLNNELVVIFAGAEKTLNLGRNGITWKQLLLQMFSSIFVYGYFLGAKYFRAEKNLLPTAEERISNAMKEKIEHL